MLAIIVPYRATTQPQRKKQLVAFIYCLMSRIPAASIYIIEQGNDKPFNRGALLNIGVKLSDLSDDDIVCFHDVDLIPCNDIIPEYLIPLSKKTVRHIGRAWKRYDSDSYLGGILMVHQCDFVAINGFPNDFWGWGGEDDELRDRINRQGYHIENKIHGTIIDQERMSLCEKLNYLNITKQKCPDKWERREWHRLNPNKMGFNEVNFTVHKTTEYSCNCFHHIVDF